MYYLCRIDRMRKYLSLPTLLIVSPRNNSETFQSCLIQLKIDSLKLEQLKLLLRSMSERRVANCRWYECGDKRFIDECRQHRLTLQEERNELLADRHNMTHLCIAKCIFAYRYNTS
ncbi:hypothetical protein Tcan_00168 [Toxocara canis]|uniref:Uncharacterized protein n=1 Tax=Toxocara canis TaxID=6265 RepID=A0A0B2VAW7_TOXCA|nr:hypothetical protein Tcan_00168 [Toxocara canis]